MWYPADGPSLRSELEGYLAEAGEVSVPGTVVAVTSPHAGYAYSGPAAAHSYKLVRGKRFEVVVCVGPIHRNPVDRASVFGGRAVLTPLGAVDIHQEVTRRLLANEELFEPGGANHEGENPVELQVPFLQMVIEGFKYVEILVRDQPLETHILTGQAIAEALEGRSALLVASTDLSHYPRRRDAEKCDRATLEAILRPDPRSARDQLNRVKERFAATPNLSCVMCGESAVLTVMAAAQAMGASDGKLLNYSNSGMTGGGSDRVVGYGAVAYYRPF
jgi:AmmeMemoRadiSam system protein B